MGKNLKKIVAIAALFAVTSSFNFSIVANALTTPTTSTTTTTIGQEKEYSLDITEDLKTYTETKEIGDFLFGVTNTGLELVKYSGTNTDLTIPDTDGIKNVTKIKAHAFEDCSGIKSITLQKNISQIEDNAFDKLNNLTTINVTSDNATYANILSEPGVLYKKAGTTLELVKYPQQKIAPQLESVNTYTINKDVTTVGVSAFVGCKGISELIINANVATIAPSAFNDSNIKKFKVNESKTYSSNIDGILFTDNGTTLMKYPQGKTNGTDNTNYPYTVSNKSNTTNQDITVTKIGDYAFQGCSQLSDIGINNGLTIVGNHAFEGCSNLKAITLPDSATKIGDFAFNGCSKITTLPVKLVTSIGEGAFNNCPSANRFDVSPNNTAYTGDKILYKIVSGNIGTATATPTATTLEIARFPQALDAKDCQFKLSAVVDISGSQISVANIRSIGKYAFQGCTQLNSIDLKSNAGADVINLNSIASNAFEDCSNLKTISLTDKITNLGEYAFKNCSTLEEVLLPTSLTSLKDYTFYKCTKLNKVSIGAAVTSASEYAFDGCSALNEIVVDENNPSYSNYNTDRILFNKDKTKIIKYPQGRNASGTTSTSDTSYTLPKQTKLIGTNSFVGAHVLTEVKIPNNDVDVVLEPHAFDNLKKVTFDGFVSKQEYFDYSISTLDPHAEIEGLKVNATIVKVPSNIGFPVTIVKDDALSNIKSVREIDLPVTVKQVGTIRNDSFLEKIDVPDFDATQSNQSYYSQDGILFKKVYDEASKSNIVTLVKYPELKNTSLVYNVPKEVNTISDYAFTGCFLRKALIENSKISFDTTKAFDSNTIPYINGIVANIKQLEVDKATFVSKYFTGSDLNLTNAKLKVTRDDNTTTTVDITKDMISGYNKDLAGTQTLIVSYGNKQTTIDVFVESKTAGTTTIGDTVIKPGTNPSTDAGTTTTTKTDDPNQSNTNTPPTGDTSNMMLAGSLVTIAMAGLAFVSIRKKSEIEE